MLYEVRYSAHHIWDVGKFTSKHRPGKHYPDDYAGKVIDVRRKGQGPSLRNMEDKAHPVIELNLTKQARHELAARVCKLGTVLDKPGPVPTTLDDRWGEDIAEVIRYNFSDPEQAERESQEVEVPTEAGRRFSAIVGTAKKLLPQNMAHTGVSYYAVKAAPTQNDDTQTGAPIENEILYTDFGAVWLLVRNAFTADTFNDPDGTKEALGLVASADDNNHRLQQVFTTINLTGYTWSCHVKPVGKTWGYLVTEATSPTAADTTYFNLSGAGSVGTQGANHSAAVITALPDGWYRIEVTFTGNASGLYMHVAFADGDADPRWLGDASTIDGYVWLPQLEKGSSATSPIDTQATAVTAGITLVTGSLGTVDEFKGGYITNVTRSETRAIIRHIDDSVTLEGVLTNWLDTDDLDIYDAWSSIQGALDQLWADQGAVTFTASQYIRIYAGIYDENVAPNVGFVPDRVNGFLLVLEGDPEDDRENIKIDPISGHAVYVECDQIRIRHVWIDCTGTAICIYSTAACHEIAVFDCKLTGLSVNGAVYLYEGGHVETCDITMGSSGGRGIRSALAGLTVKSCKITGVGKATSTQAAIDDVAYHTYSPTTIDGTVISGFKYGVKVISSRANGLRVRNTTFYDCTAALKLEYATASPIEIINSIFKDCTYNYQVIAWPEESTTQTGPEFIQRNNCYHGYTAMGYDGLTTKTYAEWSAYEQVDDSGELDTIDPLLTDPDAGDFSLQAASPCRHAGHGSGVTKDVDSNPFDPYHPDIGAVSTGIGPNVAYST